MPSSSDSSKSSTSPESLLFSSKHVKQLRTNPEYVYPNSIRQTSFSSCYHNELFRLSGLRFIAEAWAGQPSGPSGHVTHDVPRPISKIMTLSEFTLCWYKKFRSRPIISAILNFRHRDFQTVPRDQLHDLCAIVRPNTTVSKYLPS